MRFAEEIARKINAFFMTKIKSEPNSHFFFFSFRLIPKKLMSSYTGSIVLIYLKYSHVGTESKVAIHPCRGTFVL